jgi:uncharacterized protein
MCLAGHCTAAVLAAALGAAVWTSPPVTPPLSAASVQDQAPAPPAARPPATADVEFSLFLSGTRVGVEHVRLARAGSTLVISSTAQYGSPLSVTVNRFEMKYTTDWQPIELHIEATRAGRPLALATSFGMTTAINEITQNGTTTSKTDQVSARTIVLPNSFYAGYEALAGRLADTQAGAELRAYVAPQAEIAITVKSVVAEQLPSPAGILAVRRYEIIFQNPGAPLPASVTIDDRARLVRLDIPGANLRLLRSELASVATRAQPVRNAADTDVIIPAVGFSLAGTLTMPQGQGRLQHPAVILIAGSGPVDRDEVVAGIPIFAQLAARLAEQGFVVLRYDKRGVGQSGGRSERATLQDYADDLITTVKWLAKRKDIDPRHIAVAGHSEGGAVAMLAAAAENKIASLVLLAAPGTTGSELILEQQRHVLELLGTPESERQAKIDLQKRIQAAVTTEKGWESVPPELRAQADTPWFKSLLLFDPSKVMPRIKQPILIVQGDLDKQVFPHHADTLGELGRARKKAPPIEVVHLPGINHLLTPAETGEVSEYVTLPDKTITPAVVKTIVEWLKK